MKKTNKLISILLVMAMLLSMAPMTVLAATVEASGKFGASGSNLTWSLDSDGVLTVSGSGAMEDFANVSKVPWYSKITKVKTVVIESGVTNIGKDAFYGVSSLVNATISDTVTSIGNRAFSGSGLTNFEFSDAGNLKTIGNSAFNSTKIKSMVIPDGVTTLGSYVFGYGPIQSVTIPASVTSVGNYFFEETSSLNEVIFLGNKEPENVGDTVFLSCSSLAYVSVPADYEGDTFSNMKVAKAVASVAEVNGQGFATLADAISAAQSINGAELKLLSHISIDSGITIESGNFTIDLNGKELFSNGYFLLRIDGADVTIVDSAGGGIFNATNDQGNIVLEVLSGSANISGGTFNSAGYPATVRDGTLKLTGKDFVLNGNWRIGWYGGNIDLSACTADEVRIQACVEGLQASAVTLPDGWGLFKNNGTPCTDFVKNDIYVAKAGFKVTASVNPAEGGTVEGAGIYSAGATVNLTATAANGYRFVNWTQNGEEVSTSAVYTFTASKNRELTANFEIVPHTHSFTYTAGGSRIVATCVAGDCPLENGIGGMLTISAPADLYVDGTAKEATIENNLVDTSVAISDITYSAPYGLPPKDAGTYTASVTVGGATATVEFTLLNYAAKVTDKDGNAVGTYKTFADAITVAQDNEGSTLTLLDNITLTSTQIIYSGKFTLDLNGKTLLNETGVTLQINKEANVTVKNSGEGGTVKSGGTNTPAISNLGTLTVDAGNIIGKKQAVNSSGTLTVNGGKFEAEYSLYISSGETVIEDGEFNGIVCVFASCTVNGGDFTAPRISINYEDGILTVNGGTFDIDEIRILAGTVSLAGGEFTNGFVLKSENTEDTLNSFLAEGYKFYDADGNKITVADDAKIIDGYVQVKEHFVASVTDKDGNELSGSPYKTFADAITAAQGSEDSTLTLLDDIILTTRQDISSGKFTLDLNGNNLVNETDSVFYIYEEVDLTIKDSGENGTVETKRMYVDCIVNNGKLTVESGIIKGDGGIRNYGVLYFNDGTVEADFFAAITNYSSGSVYVYDGVLKGSKNSGAVDNNGTLYIYGGEIKGIANSNTAYISGGTIDRDDYAALNLLGGTVEVTGGSFTGTDNEYGDYSGTPFGEWTVCYTEGASLILKGGEFPNGFVVANTTANTFLAEDYYYKDADGKLIDVADDAKVINGYVKVTKGADLSEAVITVDKTEFVYNGQHQAPAVTVTIGGKTLTENVDYAVNARRWENDVPVQWFYYVDAGVYLSTINGMGDYTGKVEKEFVIKPATVDIIWEGDVFYYTGNPHKVTAKYVDVDGNESNEFELINYVNTDVGVYTATAIFADSNYSATEAATNHTYEIKWYDGAPDATVSGTKGENGWYTSEVTVTAPEGYTISTAVDGTYGNTITFVENEENAVYYLKQTENGYIAKVELGEIKYDLADPAAEITMAENKWNSFFNTVTFGYFFKETQSITITASDETSGITKIEYFIATEEITDFENIEWNEYTEKFNIEPNSKNIIYAKATDKAGRYVIVNSDGIVLYTDSQAVTSEATYILTSMEDVEFEIDFNGNEVAYVMCGASYLDNAQYTATENGIKLHANYIENAYTAGEYQFTVYVDPLGENFGYEGIGYDKYIEPHGDTPETITLTLTVKKLDGNVEITNDISKTYDGKAVSAPEYDIIGTGDVTVEYKVKGADDSTYTTEASVNAGEYTVRVSVAETGKSTAASATKDFTIAKKAVTVTATAPDKVYDGTTDIDYDTIVITFNGIVEGDTVGYTIKEAWYNGIVVGTDWFVSIVYNVTGEDANNYMFPEGGEYIAPDYFVEATADITAKDISDGFIILGAPLTYNGKEQTQTVEKVIPTGTAPEATYTVSGNKATNVGVYLLTVTGTGNFTGEAKIAYEIAVDMNGVDFEQLHVLNVKSTDKERIEYIYNQVDNAVTDLASDEKKAEWNNLRSICVELLTMIESVANHIESFENDLAKYDINTVTSDDAADLESLYNTVAQFYHDYFDNLTEEQTKELDHILSGISALQKKISDVAKEITRITNAVNGYDKATVKSSDKADLEQLKADIKALTDGQNITDGEREKLAELDAKLDALLKKIADTQAEIDELGKNVDSYTEDSVKSTDSEDLAQLKEDIQSLIDSDNVTENEKTALEDMIKDIEGLEDKITETEEKLEEIKDIENNFNPENVSSDDKAAIEDKIAEIEAVNPDNLTDEQKAEYEEIKAGFEALLEEIAAAEKDVADIGVELEMFDEERVTKFWEDDIEALKTKIDELLADENMGEAEKAKLNEYKAQAEKLIEIINTPKEYFSLRFFYLIWDCLTWKYNGILGFFSQIFAF